MTGFFKRLLFVVLAPIVLIAVVALCIVWAGLLGGFGTVLLAFSAIFWFFTGENYFVEKEDRGNWLVKSSEWVDLIVDVAVPTILEKWRALKK